MTNEEVKNILFNIFNKKFKYDPGRFCYYIGKNINNSKFYIYYTYGSISTSYLDIYVNGGDNTIDIINILNNKIDFGFISFTNTNFILSNKYIQFVLYEKMKNLDI